MFKAPSPVRIIRGVDVPFPTGKGMIIDNYPKVGKDHKWSDCDPDDYRHCLKCGMKIGYYINAGKSNWKMVSENGSQEIISCEAYSMENALG